MRGVINRNDMRCTAFHEAGHAVAIVLQDLSFDRVYVVHRSDETKEYTKGPLGSVVRNLHQPEFAGKLDAAKKEIVVCYAGPYSETFAYPGLRPHLEQDAPDVKDAISLAKFAMAKFSICGSSVTFDQAEVKQKWSGIVQTLDECNRAAHSMVVNNQGTITKLAGALLSRHELTRDEVVAIVKSAG